MKKVEKTILYFPAAVPHRVGRGHYFTPKEIDELRKLKRIPIPEDLIKAILEVCEESAYNNIYEGHYL